jgi:hypothetical protein
MAEKTLTGKILDNIAAGFADVQKDITDAKNAIEAAGVPSSGATKNLSEEIAKIQTKVTENIKESGNIEGFGGGTMDIKDGFIIRKNSSNTMDGYNTEPLTNNIDYRVAANMTYNLTWPTNKAIEKDGTDLSNLQHSEDEKIREKYRDFTHPFIRLHFQKNNTGRLANTNQYVEVEPYNPNNSSGGSLESMRYDLEVYLTDDTISMSDKVSQTLIDTYKLNKSDVTTDDTVIKYTGEEAMSLPAYGSKFFINETEVPDSIIVTDNFVAGIHPKVKAVICKKIFLHVENLVIGRVSIDRTRRWTDNSTKNYDIYIDKDTETLEVESDDVSSYISKYSSIQHALVSQTSKKSMINILVNKSDKMTASIKAVAIKLASIEARIYNYDRTEVFDFNRMVWISTPASSEYEALSWPAYLSPNDVNISAVCCYNPFETNRYNLVSRFKLGIDSRSGKVVDFYSIRTIEQIQAIVDAAKDGYLYKTGQGEYLYDYNTITLDSPTFTWKPKGRLGATSDSFPDMSRNVFTMPEIDGVKTATLDLSRMPSATFGVQEFPLTKLTNRSEGVLYRVILAGENGSSLEDKDLELLSTAGKIKFLGKDMTPITSISINRSSISNDKYVVPIFYNKYITEVELTGCVISRVNGYSSGLLVEEVGAEPTTPMIFKLHNCRYGEVYNGPAKNRYAEIDAIYPDRADKNAKYVRFLIDESDPILQDDTVLRLRLSFYNMDQTKKYNWSKQAWESLDSLTPDEKEYKYIANPHLEAEEEAARLAEEEEAARLAAEESAMNSSEEDTDTGEHNSEDTTEETHSEEN